MHVKIINPVGIKDLYGGRTRSVRFRINDFINDALKKLVIARVHRTSLKFQWQNFSFNHDQRKAIIDFFMHNNLIESYSRGFSFGEDMFKQSEIYPSLMIFRNISIEQEPDNRTTIKIGNSVKTTNDNDSKVLKKLSKLLNNNVNVPLIDLKRIYTNSKDYGGRVYSAYQSLSQKDRTNLIQINGNDVVELDYQNNHLNILLASFGYDTSGDFYDIMQDHYIMRDETKRAISAFLNSERPIATLTSDRGSFNWSNSLANLFLNRIYERFPELKKIKRGSVLGLSLQKFEGDVMMDIIDKTASMKKIVLPVHDSIICEKTNHDLISSMMENTWLSHIDKNRNKFTGFLK